MSKQRLCVIPARGGSQRIPRKNLKPFRGRPIIEWSISAAIEAGCFERIVVSTDDAEITDLALSLGAEVPFKRPDNLANHHATTVEVVRHAIDWYENRGQSLHSVCCLYATAPFISAEDLINAFNLLGQSSSTNFVFTATSFPYPIQRAVRLDSQGRSWMLQPEYAETRSQDLETAYHDAGQLYFGTPEAWCNHSSILEGGLPLLLPRWRVQDIDTIDDWHQAELMHELLDQKRHQA